MDDKAKTKMLVNALDLVIKHLSSKGYDSLTDKEKEEFKLAFLGLFR